MLTKASIYILYIPGWILFRSSLPGRARTRHLKSIYFTSCSLNFANRNDYLLPTATKGKLSKVYHFDSKAKVEEYVRSIGLPAIFFMPGLYMSNIPGNMLRPGAAGTSDPWKLSFPGDGEASLVPIFDVTDTGKFIKGIVLHRRRLLGHRIPCATAYASPRQLLDEFRSAYPKAGRGAELVRVPDDAYLAALKGHGMPEFAAEELLQNMQLLGAEPGGYYGGTDLAEAHSILDEGDRPTTWVDFMRKTPLFKDLQ